MSNKRKKKVILNCSSWLNHCYGKFSGPLCPYSAHGQNGRGLRAETSRGKLLFSSPLRFSGKWRCDFFFALTRFETPCLSGQREDIHGEVLLRAPARAVWDGTGLWFGLGPKWYISLTDRLIGGAEIQERVQSTLEFQNQRAPCSSIYVLNLNYF